jgi:hypothetical protein
MTPYHFGYKTAAQTVPTPAASPRAPAPVSAVKQPMAKAIATTAKNVPSMLNMARASNTNVIKTLNPISQSVYSRTGQQPSNWEMNEILSQGLPYPYPESR